MTQISLYIDDAVVDKLNAAARSMNCSASKYVSEIVSERLLEATDAKIPRSALRGCLKGKVWMADDFDAPMEEMQEYM